MFAALLRTWLADASLMMAEQRTVCQTESVFASKQHLHGETGEEARRRSYRWLAQHALAVAEWAQSSAQEMKSLSLYKTILFHDREEWDSLLSLVRQTWIPALLYARAPLL